MKQAMMYTDSCEEVLQTEYLLGEVLKRSRGSKDFLRATLVSRLWRRTARIPGVVSGFYSRNSIPFIGFILEHFCSDRTEIKLINSPCDSDKDPVRELQKSFLANVLFEKHIVGTHGGRVIVQFQSGPRAGMMYMNCPYSPRPWLFKKVARAIAPMGKNFQENRFGVFAVLRATDGPSSGYPVCFLKDYSREHRANHLGPYFEGAGKIRVHVCVYSKKVWVPHASDLLTLPLACKFQRAPYCVQSGSRLYLMYLVDLIVWFDMKTENFGAVPLPGAMVGIVRGCLEYTAGPYPRGELAIVQLEKGRLVRWVLTRNGNVFDWNKEASIDLTVALSHYMNNEKMLRTFSSDPSEWCSFQLRSVSPDGRYVVLTAGVFYGLFVVDTLLETAEGYPTPQKMGRVLPLSEYWPSKPSE